MKDDDRSNQLKPAGQRSKLTAPTARGGEPSPRKTRSVRIAIDRSQRRRSAGFLARLRRSILPIALLLAGAWGAAAKAPGIAATLEPSEIAFGDAAQLTVTVPGQDQNEPEIPAVSGLSFQPVGQSSQIQVINGAMSANISHTYIVSPTRLGTFIIPGIRAGSGADAAATRPLVLKVLKQTGSAASAAPQGGQSQTGLPVPVVNGGDDEDVAAPDQASFGFLRLIAPQREFYVGELVPVELKAFFRAGVELRVDGLPRLNSDAFTMNKLGDQPARSQQVISGVPYTVFTWATAITAVKAGEYEMRVELPTTVTLRQRIQRPHRGAGNPYGNSLFDEVFNDAFFNGFFGSATQKQAALSSRPGAVKILSVPTESRPASFTGAVGKFDLAADAAPIQAAAGDPVTLNLRISGSGNFDRVIVPVLEKSSVWKTYQPTAKFEPADSAGCSGTKLFAQALVPLQSGQLTIPALAFSFFDPETKQYITRQTRPMSIEVTPGQTAAASAAPSPAALPAPAIALPAAPDLVPNKLAPGRFAATLRPWFFNPWLAAGALLPSLALLGGYAFLRRRQRLANDPQRLRLANTRRAVQAQLKNMGSAAAQGAVLEFFAAARGALQNQLGLRWGLPAQAITLADINSRMNGEAEAFRFVFELADEVTYTGRTFPAADLQKWEQIINAELKRLEAKVSPLPGRWIRWSGRMLGGAALGLAQVASAGEQPAFDAANQACIEGKATEAARGYERIITQQGYSTPVLFNLANAQFRAGKSGAAILNYERARWLSPRDPDVVANLRLALERAKLPTAAPAWPLRYADWFSLNGWGAWGAVSLFLLAATLPLALLSPGARPALRLARIVAAVAVLGSVAAIGSRWAEFHRAVVTAKEATARLSPVTMGQVVFTLPEGATVSTVKSHGRFAFIRTPDGHQGWVSRDAVEPVVPTWH